ncbi:MAG: class I SAM-dependent methyltransferase [Vicinamibacterales bacterium]
MIKVIGNGASGCEVCGCRELSVLRTYKHDWIACADCGNLTRTLRDTYLASALVPERLGRAILPAKLADFFYPMNNVRRAADNFYRYYEGSAALSPGATKYRTETRDLLLELTARGIDLTGRSVLDISGGPGFLARDLAAIASHVVVTEFSPAAVSGMAQHLAVNAVKFDYNSDDLASVTSGPYDVVLVRYSINFCLDLQRFARSLRKILVPGGVVYVSFVAPTLGFLLRWQHDEYTVNRLYTTETMARSFVQEGFTLETRYRHPGYGFMENRGALKNAILLPFIGAYGLRNLRIRAPVSRALRHHNLVHIYGNPQHS